MGDRGNIVIRFSGNRHVWFYTHWSGSSIGTTVRTALAKNERWDDAPYLARIIFGELVGDNRGTTGFGIDVGQGDNSHPYIVVDTEAQTVSVVPEGETDGVPTNKPERTWTFAEYVAAVPEPAEAE